MSSTTFRHTKKALRKIREAMNEKGFNKTQAILYLIEREIPQPQLEQKEGEEKTVLLKCSYIPRPQLPPILQRQLDQFLRGKHSPLIQAILT